MDFLAFAFRLLLVYTRFSPATYATLYTHVWQLPTYTFDYVVIGSGAAGNVIANRLTEDSGISILKIKPCADVIIAPYEDVADTDTDEKVEEYIRKHGDTILHAVGTAGMSPENADWGVVNPDFKLKGAAGVRIVDASIFPFIPTAHTQVPTYLIAERASEIIKEDQYTDVTSTWAHLSEEL